MSAPTSAPCPHEIRPGTTTCLHCRRDARVAAQARLRRTLLGAVGAAVALSVVAVVGVKVARGVRVPRPSVSPRVETPSDAPVAQASAPDTMASVATSASSIAAAPTVAAQTPTQTPTATPAATPPLMPSIANGRTELDDGIFAVREGSNITVYFDTPSSRTRRRDKFERVVRATLPQVYGARVDSVLARIPAGELIAAGELPVELTDRGLQVPLRDGWAIELRPRTRQASDGPLVVAYEATLAR